MSDAKLLDFVAVGPPRGLAALVACHAVVGPLAGHLIPLVGLVDAGQDVVRRWRARVDELDRLGWPTARSGGGHRRWWMLN